MRFGAEYVFPGRGFALLASPEMSFEQRRKYHIVNAAEASSLIETRQVRSVLLGIFVHNERLTPRLLSHGYERTLEVPEAGESDAP